MKSTILKAGIKRAIHVFIPPLLKRQEEGWKAHTGSPVMAVRSSLYNYTKMRLYRKVEILGPSELVEMEKPLPGTKGRGVAILFTTAKIRVWYDDKLPKTVDTSDEKKLQPA